MKDQQRQDCQQEINQSLFGTIVNLSKLTLEAVRENPSDVFSLTGKLMNIFHKELTTPPKSTDMKQKHPKRSSFGDECEIYSLHFSPAASLEESMEQIQWKNNQKQTISSALEQIIIMLLRHHQPLYKTIEPPFSEKTNISTTTHTHTCLTESSTPSQHDPKQNTERNPLNFHFSRAEKQNSLGKKDSCLTSSEKSGLEKVLEILKAERLKNSKYKQSKIKCFQDLWTIYGSLLSLEKDRFEEYSVFDKIDDIRERLMKELTQKNANNQRIIKKYKKKIDLSSSQKKILKDLPHETPKDTEAYQFGAKEMTSEQLQSPSWSLPLNQSASLKKCSKKVYTIRSKPRLGPSPLSNTMELSREETNTDNIKAKVESSFKDAKKYESLGKNILTNIIFDPQSLLMSSKRKWFGKIIERSSPKKFQKSLKNNRLLLRVGGIRLSLQEYNFKKIALQNA